MLHQRRFRSIGARRAAIRDPAAPFDPIRRRCSTPP